MGPTVRNYKVALTGYKKFKQNTPVQSNFYDCLVMFSGGKDSYYLLYNLLTKHHLNPLALSIKSPFESNIALQNVQNATEKLNFDHIHFSINSKLYRAAMNKAFCYRDADTLFSERTPCTICGYITQITGFLIAMRYQIPYIVYANDPIQILGTYYDIKHDVKQLIQVCGEKLVWEMFGKENINRIFENDDKDLPSFVTPYVDVMKTYEPEKIISELKSMELYQGDSVQTYCSLVSILNYYAFTNYDTAFFAHQLSQNVRLKKMDRETLKKYCEGYKHVITNIAIKDHIDEKDRKYIYDVLSLMYQDDEKIMCELENIVDMKRIAGLLGIDLSKRT